MQYRNLVSACMNDLLCGTAEYSSGFVRPVQHLNVAGVILAISKFVAERVPQSCDFVCRHFEIVTNLLRLLGNVFLLIRRDVDSLKLAYELGVN